MCIAFQFFSKLLYSAPPGIWYFRFCLPFFFENTVWVLTVCQGRFRGKCTGSCWGNVRWVGGWTLAFPSLSAMSVILILVMFIFRFYSFCSKLRILICANVFFLPAHAFSVVSISSFKMKTTSSESFPGVPWCRFFCDQGVCISEGKKYQHQLKLLFLISKMCLPLIGFSPF